MTRLIYVTVGSLSRLGCQAVGVLLSPRLVSAAVGYKAINPRLLWIRFKLGITRVLLLAAYAPVSSVLLGELEEFWKSVRDVLRSVRENEKIIICGDLNRWIGTARSDYEEVLSDKRIIEAGKLILKISKERYLFVADTMFDHKQIDI